MKFVTFKLLLTRINLFSPLADKARRFPDRFSAVTFLSTFPQFLFRTWTTAIHLFRLPETSFPRAAVNRAGTFVWRHQGHTDSCDRECRWTIAVSSENR